MKKSQIVLIIVFFLVGFFGFKLVASLIISNPKIEDCIVKTETITKISEGTSYDITFKTSSGDSYYINRGLERGLNLDSLNAKVLNKTVTLHLPDLWTGASSHISQLTVDETVIFTEFKAEAKSSED